ncbi:MAG: hypothetical protein M1830_008363 [Pleopsidium flavum]|nr:MAG: hypothetical protein M1830_008363 [Pleopsidium flavum]
MASTGMSAEMIRKRGRPRKPNGITPFEADIVEISPPAKTTARKRSTKAAASVETSVPKPSTAKPSAKLAASAVPGRVTTPSIKQSAQPSPPPAQAPKPTVNQSPVTPATSTILKAVADKRDSASDHTTKNERPILKGAPVEEPSIIPTQSRPSAPSPALSPASINAYAVSQLSSRPSRPPPKIGDGRLPEKYKPAARRITFVIVALPIAIVTSYVLYQRLVLGQERKRLIRLEDEPKVAGGS